MKITLVKPNIGRLEHSLYVDSGRMEPLPLGVLAALTPMPGTALYERLRGEGRLLYDRWWLAPEFRYGEAIFRPRRMTPEELTEGCFRARRAFNTYRSVFRRALDWRTNCRSPGRLGVYLLGNLVSRREIFRKQGLALGDDGPLPLIEGACENHARQTEHRPA